MRLVDKVSVAVVLIGVVMLGVLAGYGILANVGTGAHHARPTPAVTVVKLANGQAVTCITIEHSTTCDFAGFRTDPNYGKASTK